MTPSGSGRRAWSLMNQHTAGCPYPLLQRQEEFVSQIKISTLRRNPDQVDVDCLCRERTRKHVCLGGIPAEHVTPQRWM
jgi:hypothetical protein